MDTNTILFRLLPHYVWGYMNEDKEFVNLSKQFCQEKPVFEDLPEGVTEEQVRSYQSYLETIVPKPEKSHKNYDDIMKEVVSERDKLRTTMFSDKKKSTYKLKSAYDKVLKSLSLNRVCREALKARSLNQIQTDRNNNTYFDDSIPVQDEMLRKLYVQEDDVRCLLLPSFLKTLVNLRKSKRNFALIFRTFGSDLAGVALELNRLCEGTHPLYDGNNGTSLVKFDGVKTKDYRIDVNKNVGNIYRFDNDQIILVMDHNRQKFNSYEEVLAKYQNTAVPLYKNAQEIYVLQNGLSENNNATLFMVEDYQYWEEYGKGTGKQFYIDPYNTNCSHIFFDDNVDKEIVDARNPLDLSLLDCSKYLNQYVVYTDTVRAITEQDYFTKKIEECEHNIAEFLSTVNQENDQMQALEDQKEQQNEFLKTCSNSEYLRATVMPILTVGLKQIDFYRPQDPLSFLGIWMLQNKKLIKDEELE